MIDLNLKQQLALGAKYPKTSFNFLMDKVFYQNKATPFPRLINCFITENCNFDCSMCHLRESRLRKRAQLSFKVLKKVFDEAKSHVPSFQLTGGEPLLHPEVGKIIAYLTKNKMVKGLVTNGLLLEEKAKELIDAGLDFLAISLDGADEATQYQRGQVKGSFDKIIRGIEKVVNLRGKKLLPNIRIATVISPFNLNNFDKVLRIAEDLGVDQWSLSHYFYYFKKIKQAQTAFARKNQMGGDVWGEYLGDRQALFNSRERRKIKQKIGRLRQVLADGKARVRITMQKGVDVDKYYTGVFPSPRSICTSPYNQVFIRGDGEVEMCQGYILGDIKRKKMVDIWQGQKAKHFRKVFKTKGIMPACFRCCALEIKFD